MTSEPAIRIGLEIHIPVATVTKLFCACPTTGASGPNTRVCPVCLGFPGARPSLSEKPLRAGITVALALGMHIAPALRFARKCYFYPDLSKNYQITQEIPLGTQGIIQTSTGTKITLRSIHVEEDPASSRYDGSMRSAQQTLLDYNRSGCPLLELVTEPVIPSPEEARALLDELSTILRTLGVFDPEIAGLKADANISLTAPGCERVEVKNIGSARDVEKALRFERTRQLMLWKRQRPVARETRGWDDVSSTTFTLRAKEESADYGMIPDDDIPVVAITSTLIDQCKAALPELPRAKAARWISQFAIAPDDAHILARDPAVARLFEALAQQFNPVTASKWMRKDVLRFQDTMETDDHDAKQRLPTVTHAVQLLQLLEKKQVTSLAARRILQCMLDEHIDPLTIAKRDSLVALQGSDDLSSIVDTVIAAETKAVASFQAGETKSFDYLVGKVIRASQGRADPLVVRELLTQRLK